MNQLLWPYRFVAYLHNSLQRVNQFIFLSECNLCLVQLLSEIIHLIEQFLSFDCIFLRFLLQPVPLIHVMVSLDDFQQLLAEILFV